MIDFCIDFEWERPKKRTNGFLIVDAPGYMSRRLIRRGRVEFEKYRPFQEREYSGLFRTFAFLEPMEESIVSFANFYGCYHNYSIGIGSDISSWVSKINEIKKLVSVWDALNEMNWSELRSLLHRTTNEKQLAKEAASLLFREVVFVKSQDFLINLRHRIDLFSWHKESKRLIVSVKPSCLIDAMYVQFAWAIMNNKQYGQCEACGKWFEIGTGLGCTYRADRKLCSPTCNTRSYRARQKKAAELHASGHTVKQIAKEIGSDVNTIKAWLAKASNKA